MGEGYLTEFSGISSVVAVAMIKYPFLNQEAGYSKDEGPKV